MCRSMQKPNVIDALKIRCCAVQSCEKCSLHCILSDPNVRKERMNFIFNEVPDNVSKNLGPFVHFILLWIRLQTRHNSKQNFQKDGN